MKPWIRYLLAFLVFGHGLIYVSYGPSLPAAVKEWDGTSWLLSGTVTGDRLKALSVFFHVAAGVATLACAVAIAFVPAMLGWWRPLAFAGSILGIMAFGIFWDGQSRLLVGEGFIGAIVSLVLFLFARRSQRRRSSRFNWRSRSRVPTSWLLTI